MINEYWVRYFVILYLMITILFGFAEFISIASKTRVVFVLGCMLIAIGWLLALSLLIDAQEKYKPRRRK